MAAPSLGTKLLLRNKSHTPFPPSLPQIPKVRSCTTLQVAVAVATAQRFHEVLQPAVGVSAHRPLFPSENKAGSPPNLLKMLAAEGDPCLFLKAVQ